MTQPIVVHDQHASGLRFGDRRVLALMQTLCLFALSPTGFRHRDVRARVAQLLGRDHDAYAAGPMTYDLRRLRLHGLIERVPRSHRYRITPLGAQTAIFYVRLYARAVRPAASLPHRAHARANAPSRASTPHSRTSYRRSNWPPEKHALITHNSSVQDS